MFNNVLLASLMEDSNKVKQSFLTEASKDDDQDADADAPDDNAEDTSAEDAPEETEDTDNPDDNTDKDPDDENKDDDNDEEKEDDEQEDKPEEDDFNFDDDSADDADTDPAPDGLPDPDDDGSDDINEGEEVETNVHTNVLDLSKLDRALAKKKCYQDYMDLRATIAGMLNILHRNETVVEPDVRDDAERQLNELKFKLEEFIKYRFGIMNYEDALQHYFIFIKSMNNILNYLKEEGLGKK